MALTVKLWDPVFALRFTVMVIVEVPAPVIEVGLKLTEILDATPEAESEIVPLNPPVTAVVIVPVLEVPLEIVNDEGDALALNPVFGLVTVRETVVVSVVLPEVPVTVMV